MSDPAYMSLEGANQGRITGECDWPGFEGWMRVFSFDHRIAAELDPATGLPVDKPAHRPVKIVKHVNKASPKLYAALASGELVSVTIKFYQPDVREYLQRYHYFTFKLEDAVVASIRPWSHSSFASVEPLEEVTMSYRKIAWVWEPDGIRAEWAETDPEMEPAFQVNPDEERG